MSLADDLEKAEIEHLKAELASTLDQLKWSLANEEKYKQIVRKLYAERAASNLALINARPRQISPADWMEILEQVVAKSRE